MSMSFHTAVAIPGCQLLSDLLQGRKGKVTDGPWCHPSLWSAQLATFRGSCCC